MFLVSCAPIAPRMSSDVAQELQASEIALKSARESLQRDQSDDSHEMPDVMVESPRTPVHRVAIPVTVERRAPAPVVQSGPRPVPCYLHRPPGVPESEIIEFVNDMDRPIGFRVNGYPVQVVGATMPSRAALPAGVQLAPSMVPPGQKCFFAMMDPGGETHVDAIMYRIDPYNGGVQIMQQKSGYYSIRYPRKYSYQIYFHTIF